MVVGDALELPDAEGILDATDTGVDAFTELNTAFMRGTAVVSIPPGVTVDNPVIVLHWFDGEGTAAFPRTVLRAGADSQVTVVEHQASADVSALVDPVVQIDVSDAGRLRYVNVQQLGPASPRLATRTAGSVATPA